MAKSKSWRRTNRLVKRFRKESVGGQFYTRSKLTVAQRRMMSSPKGLKGFGEVTAKDFRAFASLLCKHGASDALVSDLTDYFGSQNPRFDAARFQKATRTCR
jgi:hypothetical protein